MENCDTELRNLSEESECLSCSSPCSFESDEEKSPWFQCVRSNGHLFYIEQDISLDPFLKDALVNSFLSDQPQLYDRKAKSKLKATEKFKIWMKEKGKKVRESFLLLKSKRTESLTSSSYINSSQVQSKDIFIDIDSKIIARHSKLSLSEEVLGLKLGSLNNAFEMHDKVIVLGVSYDQDIHGIKVGDWLKSINDIYVNMNNIEDIIKELLMPSRVKLTIISPLDTKSYFVPPRHMNFTQCLCGDSSALQCAKLQYHHIPHGLFLFSLEHGFFENDEILYCYPNENMALYQLKGMFLTLGNIIKDVASSPLLSCSVMTEGKLVHVGFLKEENEMMVFCLPASVASMAEVQHFTTGLAKLFKYQFSSLKKTFKFESDDRNNFMTLLFEHYLSSVHYKTSKFPEPHLLDILPSVHWLPLSDHLKTEIDDILSELESSDFEVDTKGFYQSRRIYNIFGSCLFYKGYLLSSHLPKDDLLDIHLFLLYNHILELTQTQPVSQAIIWQEVFPSRHQECISNDPQFEETHGRWFLLIVAMHHCILAVLLDDDGCSLIVEDLPAPEPFYIEEVQNTLFILQDCGITSAAEKLLNCYTFPEVSSNLFFEKNSSQNSLSSSNISIQSGHNLSLSYSASHSSLSADKEVSHTCPANGESDSESSNSNSLNESPSSIQTRSRSHSVSTGSTSKSHESTEYFQIDADFTNHLSQMNSSSLPNLSAIPYSNFGPENSFSIVSGFGNSLFYYLHMDPVEGIFIAPVISDLASMVTIQSTILDSFHRCCLNMRSVFERSLRNREILKANIKTKYGVNGFLQNAYEQGVLIQYNDADCMKQKENQLNFWVVGRLFFTPEPREIYVCYQDCAAQDIVELAFRLGFGLSL